VSIPDYQTLMFPFLQAIADGKTHHMQDITRQLADKFKLTDKCFASAGTVTCLRGS
jgi:restriction endonuclease Mrr